MRPTHMGVDRPDRQSVPRDLGIGRAQMRHAGNLAAAQHQRGLDQAGNAGRRLQVTDIGLHRSDKQGLAIRAAVRMDRRERADLDRIAERGAGAMRLHVADLARRNAGIVEGFADHRLLGEPVGHREAAAAAVLVHRGAPDDGPDPGSARERIGQPCQDHDTCSLRHAHSRRRWHRKSCNGHRPTACGPVTPRPYRSASASG